MSLPREDEFTAALPPDFVAAESLDLGSPTFAVPFEVPFPLICALILALVLPTLLPVSFGVALATLLLAVLTASLLVGLAGALFAGLPTGVRTLLPEGLTVDLTAFLAEILTEERDADLAAAAVEWSRLERVELALKLPDFESSFGLLFGLLFTIHTFLMSGRPARIKHTFWHAAGNL